MSIKDKWEIAKDIDRYFEEHKTRKKAQERKLEVGDENKVF